MSGTVLCVDDDRNLCQIIAKALGGEGYRVLTAFDGDEALEVFAESQPELVLVDLILPRRDGFAVLEAIRAQQGAAAATPAVVISGCSPTPEYSERAAALGVLEFLTKPVPLTKLLEVVADALRESKPGVPAEGHEPPRPAPRGDHALRGRLDRVPFPALLHHLHGLRATGVLHLESGKKRKWIGMRDGQSIAVRSNLVNECLGHYLLRSGRIKHAELEESLRRMKGGQLQGEILVAMDVLDEDEIVEALHAQADEKLFDVFAWEEGTFRFEKGGDLERANAIGVQRSPANLILHGVRDRFPGHWIETFFRSNADCVVAHSESPYYRFQEIELDPDHVALLQSLDGTRRVSAILAEDEHQSLARTLYALVSTGLLTLRGGSIRGGSPLPTPPTPPPPVRRVGATKPVADPDLVALQARAEKFRSRNHFEILGVTASASQHEVERAYAALAEEAHPDRYKDSGEAVRAVAEEVFAMISRAHTVLMNPRQRSVYVLDQRREERTAEKEEAGLRALQAASQFQRGEALLKTRAYEEALVCFGQALELNPEEGDYSAHYGWALHLCHPSDATILAEAVEHVRNGLKLASHSDRAYLYMGRLFRAMGKPAGAEKMFTRAVQIQPDCVEALRELRLINMRRERSKGLIKRLLRR